MLCLGPLRTDDLAHRPTDDSWTHRPRKYGAPHPTKPTHFRSSTHERMKTHDSSFYHGVSSASGRSWTGSTRQRTWSVVWRTIIRHLGSGGRGIGRIISGSSGLSVVTHIFFFFPLRVPLISWPPSLHCLNLIRRSARSPLSYSRFVGYRIPHTDTSTSPSVAPLASSSPCSSSSLSSRFGTILVLDC